MKKRILSALLMMAILLSCLAGCASINCSTSVNSDGSGVVSMRFGVTKEALGVVANNISHGASWADVLDGSQTVPFTKDGVTYYGTNEQHSFTDLTELSRILGGIGSSSDVGLVMNLSGITLLQDKTDGSFTLTAKDLYNAGGVDDAIEQLGGGVAYRTEQLKELSKSLDMEISFTFPSTVVQTAGTNAGVTVNGNTVTMNIIEMDGAYSFSTSTGAVSNVDGPFSDVALNAWYCNAVTALSKGGLVNGMGNGKFQPMDTITYSQLCQIIAKAKGLPTGDENGYWAGKAIQSCVNGGFLASRGPVTAANYDIAISREAATSALMRAIPQDLLVEVNANPVIPDSSAVAPEFLTDVLNAYRYGVAKGTGDGSFSPKSNLSRAEVCQLLFNIGWTSPV